MFTASHSTARPMTTATQVAEEIIACTSEECLSPGMDREQWCRLYEGHSLNFVNTRIPGVVLKEELFPPRALYLWQYIFASLQRESWSIRIDHRVMENYFKMGESCIRRLLSHLVEEGFLNILQQRQTVAGKTYELQVIFPRSLALELAEDLDACRENMPEFQQPVWQPKPQTVPQGAQVATRPYLPQPVGVPSQAVRSSEKSRTPQTTQAALSSPRAATASVTGQPAMAVSQTQSQSMQAMVETRFFPQITELKVSFPSSSSSSTQVITEPTIVFQSMPVCDDSPSMASPTTSLSTQSSDESPVISGGDSKNFPAPEKMLPTLEKMSGSNNKTNIYKETLTLTETTQDLNARAREGAFETLSTSIDCIAQAQAANTDLSYWQNHPLLTKLDDGDLVHLAWDGKILSENELRAFESGEVSSTTSTSTSAAIAQSKLGINTTTASNASRIANTLPKPYQPRQDRTSDWIPSQIDIQRAFEILDQAHQVHANEANHPEVNTTLAQTPNPRNQTNIPAPALPASVASSSSISSPGFSLPLSKPDQRLLIDIADWIVSMRIKTQISLRESRSPELSPIKFLLANQALIETAFHQGLLEELPFWGAITLPNLPESAQARQSQPRYPSDVEAAAPVTKAPNPREPFLATLCYLERLYDSPQPNPFFPNRNILHTAQQVYQQKLESLQSAAASSNPFPSDYLNNRSNQHSALRQNPASPIAVSLPKYWLNRILGLVKNLRLSQNHLLELAYHLMHFSSKRKFNHLGDKLYFHFCLAINLIKSGRWTRPKGLSFRF